MRLGKKHQRTAWASLLIAIPISLLVAVLQLQVELRAPLQFVVSLALTGTESAPRVKAHYDTGQGFDMTDSATVTAIADGDFHRLNFELSDRPVTKVRLEVVTRGGDIRIDEASVRSSDGMTLHRFKSVPIAIAGVVSSRVAAGRILESSVAPDPGGPAPHFLYLIPASSESFRDNKSHLRGALLFLKWLCPIFALVLVVCVLASVAMRAWRRLPEAWTWLKGLRDDGRKGGELSPTISLGVAALALLAYVGLLVFRSWSNISTPNLYVEDATHYFNFYYGGNNPLGTVLQRPHGYYNLFNNLVAWLASMIDVRSQPAAYLAVSFTCAVTTVSCLLLSGLFKTRWVLLIAPTIVGLAGMNHIYYYVTLTYQMYVVIVLLICLMLCRPPKSNTGFALLCLLYALLIWSGPYSVLAVPAAILFIVLFKDMRRTILMSWVIVCTLAYSFTADSLVQLSNLFDPAIIESILRTLVDRVLFLGWIESLPLRAAIVGAAVAALYLLRKDAYFYRYSLILAAIAGVSLMPLFLSVKFADYPDPYPCHVFIAQFLWWTWLLLAFDRLLLTKRTPKWFPGVMVACFLALVYADNRAVSWRVSVPPMAELVPFLEAVNAAEQLDLEGANAFAVLRYPGSYFPPKIRVGSRQADARRLHREDPSLGAVNPRYLR